MNIIFIREHIVDDEYGIKVKPGRTGVLLDDSTGTIQLDEISPCMNMNQVIIWGKIDGVQPSCYIPKREEV